MDEQIAVDRILETENLTDGLEDDDANWLLNWGIAHVKTLIAGIEDDEQAGEVVNNLMDVMRNLNQITADRTAKAPELLAEDIKLFFQNYGAVFPQAHALKRGEAKRIATKLSTLSAGEMLQQLISIAEQAT